MHSINENEHRYMALWNVCYVVNKYVCLRFQCLSHTTLAVSAFITKGYYNCSHVPTQSPRKRNWLMTAKCDLVLKFLFGNIVKCACSHYDKYIIFNTCTTGMIVADKFTFINTSLKVSYNKIGKYRWHINAQYF